VELQTAAALSKPDLRPLGLLAYAYSRTGQRAKAEVLVRDLDLRARQALLDDKLIPTNIMVPAYLAIGDKDRALAWLEKAYERGGGGGMFSLNAEECYRPLRSDARFQDLMRRVGLPQGATGSPSPASSKALR